MFEAIPLVDLEVLKAREGQPLPARGLRRRAGRPAGHRLPSRVPERCRRAMCSSSSRRSAPLWQLGEPLHNPVVAKQDKDSPLMAHVRLDNVLMPEARKLTFKRQAQVLAESAAGDPLYAVLDRPAAKGKVSSS